MQIVIDLKACYDWSPAEDGVIPTEADLLALKFKPAQNGKWLKKIIKDGGAQTAINLPEAEINDCMNHFNRIGNPKTRPQLVLWYLDTHVIKHHSASENFIKIQAHGEPEVEAFLNMYYGLDVKKDVPDVVKTGV